MEKLRAEIRAAIGSKESIPRERVRRWMREAKEVETFARLYQFTDEAWNRIEPRLERQETCQLIRSYLLRCIRENPDGGVALNRYEAARGLEAWFDHLANSTEGKQFLEESARAVTDLFLTGSDNVRDAIEMGFLEHLLEQERLRPLFAYWAKDERLCYAWERALAWGEAHPNFTKTLRESLRD